MNRLFFVIASVLITGLSACNKELDQAPTPAKARVSAEKGFPPIVVSQKHYQLTKQGEMVITYDSFPFNRISKTASSSSGYTVYEYNDTPGNRSVKTSRYMFSQLLNTATYQLDDNGLCLRADYTTYVYVPDYSDTLPAETEVIHTQYGYTNGRLYFKNSTKEWAFYGGKLTPAGNPETSILSYNASGDLTGQQTFAKQKKIAEITYGYGPSVGQPDMTDKLPLNSEDVVMNPYLKVFGSFNEHLIRSRVLKYFDGSTPPGGLISLYDYVLNDEGYVTSRTFKRGGYTKTDAYTYYVSTRPF